MEHIFKMVAAQNHTTVEEVRSSIQAMIEDCYNSDDPKVRKAWRELLPDGRMPTPDELVLSGAMKLLGPSLAAQQADNQIS